VAFFRKYSYIHAIKFYEAIAMYDPDSIEKAIAIHTET
jgi:hypothetical protein